MMMAIVSVLFLNKWGIFYVNGGYFIKIQHLIQKITEFFNLMLQQLNQK